MQFILVCALVSQRSWWGCVIIVVKLIKIANIDVIMDTECSAGKLIQDLLVDIGYRNAGAGFPMNETTKSGLALDNAIRHIHLATKCRKIDNDLKE